MLHGVTFNEKVIRRVSSILSHDISTEEMWSVIRDGFVADPEVVLGNDCCQQPNCLF